MAIGDQVHYFVGQYPTGYYRPASGVEVVLKEINTQITGSSTYHFIYHRTVSNVYNYEIILCGNKYNTYQSKAAAAKGDAGDNGESQMGQQSIPVNYDNYVNFNYLGSTPYGSKIAGYITKE